MDLCVQFAWCTQECSVTFASVSQHNGNLDCLILASLYSTRYGRAPQALYNTGKVVYRNELQNKFKLLWVFNVADGKLPSTMEYAITFQNLRKNVTRPKVFFVDSWYKFSPMREVLVPQHVFIYNLVFVLYRKTYGIFPYWFQNSLHFVAYVTRWLERQLYDCTLVSILNS